MGLYEEAARSYDNLKEKVGVYEGNKFPLAPICHMVLPVEVEVTIDKDGKFISAKELINEIVTEKKTTNKKGEVKVTTTTKTETKRIILPVTESSMGRTSGISPHPLTEELQYVSKSINTKKYDAYIELLSSFCCYTDNESVWAIYNYVSEHDLAIDILESNITVSDKTRITWHVLGEDPIWNNTEVFDAWINYYTNNMKENDNNDAALNNVIAGYGRLISANYAENFVGRFLDRDEACVNNFMLVQKAERFLRWVVANEGVSIGSRRYVCWNPNNGKSKDIRMPFANVDDCATFESYKDELRKELFTLKNSKDALEKVIVVGFDSLTGYRTAVCYYSEFSKSDFYERLEKWDETCTYYDSFRKSISTVPLYKIVKYAYGTQQGDVFEMPDRCFAGRMQSLIHHRMTGAPITKEIVQKLFDKSKALNTYKNNNRINITNIASAMVNKYYIDNKKGEFDMANVEEKKMDRSYQFGRLLAIYERIEKLATDQNDRDTTALKLERRYCDRPLSTAMMIETNIKRPYLSKLKEGQKVYFEKLIGDTWNMIVECDGDNDRPLSESFIVGYHMQKNSFFRKKETTEMTEDK